MPESDPQTSISVSLIGNGRLAHSLVPALIKTGVVVQSIITRNPEAPSDLLPGVRHIPLNQLRQIPGDFVILTINDTAIREVARHVRPMLAPGQILVHSSGAMALTELDDHPETGVLYPLQTFTKEQVVPFDSPAIPLFVEGSSAHTRDRLLALAQRLSPVVHEMDSDRRKRLHLGAVFCCNFVNHLFRITDELTGEIPFSAYEPLIRNQLTQSLKLGPATAQTGPASRGDVATLLDHLDLMKGQPDLQAVYRLLSRLINPQLPDLPET